MPEYNPIEMVFSKIKQYIRKRENNYTKKNLLNNIKESIKRITKQDLTNYYKHSLEF